MHTYMNRYIQYIPTLPSLPFPDIYIICTHAYMQANVQKDSFADWHAYILSYT